MIIAVDEAVEIGISLGVIGKASVVSCSVFRHTLEMLSDASVEALDHSVCLRPKWPGEAMFDVVGGANSVERVLSGGFVGRFVFLVDGEAVGELGSVVGKDGVDLKRKAFEEALEEGGGGRSAAVRQDFEVNEAGGAVDGDISIRASAIEGWQIFDVDMDEAGRGFGFEGDDRLFVWLEAGGELVAFEAAVNGAAGEGWIEASAHGLNDVIERQGEAAAQLDDQIFLALGDRGADAVRAMRSVGCIGAGFPASHGSAADAEFAGEVAVGG